VAKPLTPLILIGSTGLSDDAAPLVTEARKAASLINLYPVGNKLVRRPGATPICTSLTAARYMQGLAWCYLPASSPMQYAVTVDNGTCYDAYNAGAGFGTSPTALTGGGSRFATTGNVGMAVVDSKLYLGDGTNQNCRFNGTNVKRSGSITPTTAPTFNAFVGAGVLTGNVQYKLVYLDADGNESQSSSASAVLAPVAQNVTLNIANDTDADRSGKNLYRKGTSSSDYKLVNASPIGATATTYTDSTTDANLGAILTTATYNQFPACQVLWEHDNRLLGCISGSDRQTLFISNEFAPWYCPNTTLPDVPTQGIRLKIQGSATSIIGGISHGGYSFIFSMDSGYILQGSTADDYRLEKFVRSGCISERTIVSAADKLFWLSREGVYMYDGTETTLVSEDDLHETMVTLLPAVTTGSCGWYYKNRYYLDIGSGLYYYDIPKRFWGKLLYPYTIAKVVTAPQLQSTDMRVFAIGRDAATVHRLEYPALATDNNYLNSGQAIACTWKSKILDMGLPVHDKRVHLFGAKFKKATGLATVKVYYSGSTSEYQSESFDLATVDDDASATITTPTIAVCRREGIEQLRSEMFQMEITSSTTGPDFEILEADLMWRSAN
jgi:hypothetical protein